MNPHQQFLALKRQCDMQSQIRKMIRNDNQADCEFFYNTDETNGLVYLTVVTINPKHREMFTLHQTVGYKTSTECLDEVISYLNNLREPNSGMIPYKVKWYNKNTGGDNTSTFYVKNVPELITKFFENKNPNDYTIQLIEMLPLS